MCNISESYSQLLHCIKNVPEKVECELLKVSNHRGHPRFYFKINGKFYFYGLRGIKMDSRIILRCTKTYQDEKGKCCSCMSYSNIIPSEFLKEIIHNSPKYSKHPKFLDKSHPRVYDMENYDMNSFEMGIGRVRTWEILILIVNFYKAYSRGQ